MMAHDFVICQDDQNTKMGMTEMSLNLAIPVQGIAILQAKLKSQHLMEICLRGTLISPQKALAYQVVTKLITDGDFVKARSELVKSLGDQIGHREAIKGIKQNLYGK